jgi:hypothetical protein
MYIRKFTLRALAASLIVAAAITASAQAPSTQDLVGTWNLTLTSPQGSHPTTVVIREDAGQLVGEMTGLPTVGGLKVTTSDAGVSLTFAIDYQGQPVDVVMVGKLSGAEMKGTVDYANGAAMGDFTGTKAGAAGATAAPATTDATSVSGTWLITAAESSPGWSMDLVQDGTNVSGTLKNAEQGLTLQLKGTLESGALSLNVTGDRSGTMKGTLEGGALKGSYDVGGDAGSWSASRKP